MKNTKRKLLAGISLAVACSVLMGYYSSPQTGGFPALKPFVAHEGKQMLGKDRQLRNLSERIVAHRADGSFTERYTGPAPEGTETGWWVDIVDTSTRRQIILEPFTKSVITFLPSDAELRQLVQSQRACEDPDVKKQVADQATNHSKLLGYGVLGVTLKTTGSTTWAWVAPDLDCYALQETTTFAKGGRTDRWVEKIDAGDPPESLFDIPADYTERSPAEVESAFRSKYHGHILFGDVSVKVLQQRYESQRRK